MKERFGEGLILVAAWALLFGAQDVYAKKGGGREGKGCLPGSAVESPIPVSVIFGDFGIKDPGPGNEPPNVYGIRADNATLMYLNGQLNGQNIVAVIDCNGQIKLGRADVQNADPKDRQIVLDFRNDDAEQGDGRCGTGVEDDCKSDSLFADTGGQVQWFFSLRTGVYGNPEAGDPLNDYGLLQGGAYAMASGTQRLARLKVGFCDPTAPLGRAKFCYGVRFSGDGPVGNSQNIPGYDETTPVLITRFGDTWTIQADSNLVFCAMTGRPGDTSLHELCVGGIANLRASAHKRQGPTHEGNFVMPVYIMVEIP